MLNLSKFPEISTKTVDFVTVLLAVHRIPLAIKFDQDEIEMFCFLPLIAEIYDFPAVKMVDWIITAINSFRGLNTTAWRLMG
jgi:hypothetical protein